jgi:aminopeptidase YwaD
MIFTFPALYCIMIKSVFEKLRNEVSGDIAFNHVAEVAKHHRIQVSPGIRAAVNYSVGALKGYGLDTEVKSWPSTGKEFAWSSQMFQEWSCEDAELKLVEPMDQARFLARYNEQKIHVIQRSFSTPKGGVTAEVVVLNKGEEEVDYKGLDVSGKVVLTSGDVQRVHELAVEKHGAVGILCDGMFQRDLNLKEGELDDALKYTSFWWAGGEKQAWGFVLTPRTGRWLRRLVEKSKTPIKVHAEVKSKLYPGTMEDAVATIPGKTKEEVTVIAHICHPQPSANDNASGTGAAMEAARAIHLLIERKLLPQPRRTIRFTLVPEMAGTFPWLEENEKRIPDMVAALNLDMVGEKQELCGGPLVMERTPEAMSSYVNSLIEAIYDSVKQEVKNLGGSASYPLFKHAVTPFSGGSDHYVYSDPNVGIACPMIIQWPDKFYHTSWDTIDKVDPEMLRKVALITATYAYFIANAGPEEALWLAHETYGRERLRLLQRIQAGINSLIDGTQEEAPYVLAKLRDRVDYWSERAVEAIKSVKRLAPKDKILNEAVEKLVVDLDSLAKSERKKAEVAAISLAAAKGWGSLKSKRKRLVKHEKEADVIVPKRLFRGPPQTRGWMKKLTSDERESLRELGKKHPNGRSATTLSFYWADGERSLLEISRLVELESGNTDTEYLVGYYGYLEKMGLVKLSKK